MLLITFVFANEADSISKSDIHVLVENNKLFYIHAYSMFKMMTPDEITLIALSYKPLHMTTILFANNLPRCKLFLLNKDRAIF